MTPSVSISARSDRVIELTSLLLKALAGSSRNSWRNLGEFADEYSNGRTSARFRGVITQSEEANSPVNPSASGIALRSPIFLAGLGRPLDFLNRGGSRETPARFDRHSHNSRSIHLLGRGQLDAGAHSGH